MTTPRVHRWIERSDWSAAEPIARAHVVVAIDPGTCGALVVVQREGGHAYRSATWNRPDQARSAVELVARSASVINRPIVLVEEPVFVSSGLAAVGQGWDAAWIASEVARACGATDVVRVFASTWQAAVLGAAVRRGTDGPDGKRARLPRGEARKALKAAALAQLPADLAASVASKARREALADAYGLARWGLLLEAGEGAGEGRAA